LTEEQLQKAVSELAFKNRPQRRQPEKKLSDIIRMYLDEKGPNLKKRTVRDYETIFAKIVSIMGNKELRTYTRLDAIRLRSKLLSEELKERSCNKHLVHLSSLLRWAVSLALCQLNFAEGLLLGIPSRRDSERKRLDVDDLKRIFSSIPLKDGDQYNVWIPLIALYSGMRREEICQLQCSDIRQVEGIWVFDINDKGEKTTKTEASYRLVPIHSKLLEMGFLTFCSERAKCIDTGNLWGFVRWRESWGKTWGGRFNQWFATNVKTEE
jgi:integrase